MGRFTVPETVLLRLSWKEYRRNNKSLRANSHDGLKQWKDCQESLNGNWLALMESVLRPGAWRALVSLLKIRDSHRRLHLKPGGFLVTKKRELRFHWRWKKGQRIYWTKKLRKPNEKTLAEENEKGRTKYLSVLGTTELYVTQLGSGVDAVSIALAGERFEGALTTMLAVLSGGIHLPAITKRLVYPRSDKRRFRPGPTAASRIFSITLDSFQPKPPSKMLLLR